MIQWEPIESTTETWNFREDKELIGEFVEIEVGVGPNKANVYTFKRQDGSLVNIWGNTILDQRFRDLEKGQLIKIVYKGRTVSEKTGREYHDFDVFVAKTESCLKDEDVISDEEIAG